MAVVGDAFRELDRILRMSNMTKASSATVPQGEESSYGGAQCP